MKSSLQKRESYLLSILFMVFISAQLRAQHCTSSPIITIPEAYLGCPGDSILPNITGEATAVSGNADACPQEVTVDFSDAVFKSTACEVIIRRTWTAEYTDQDSIPLTSSREQILWLKDSDLPVIHNCPESVILEESNPTYTWSLPTASDDCGIDTLYSDYVNGSSFPVGTTIVTYTAVDKCGNLSICSFNVTVQQCSPIITLDCPKKYNGCPSDSIDVQSLGIPTVYISSDSCGEVSLTHRDSIVRDKICNQKIIRVWTASIPGTDLTTECTQVIKLKDKSGPHINHCPPNVTLDIDDATYHWDEPTAVDDCKVASFTSNIHSGFTFPLGSTEVIYTAKDLCGDSTSCSFTVTIEENQCSNEFDLVCPEKYTGCQGASYHPNNTGKPTIVYASDHCQNVSLTFEDRKISDTNCKLKIDRTWIATLPGTDIQKQCVQRIKLIDDQAPAISNCPSDVTISSDIGTYTWSEPQVTDNCGSAVISSNVPNGSNFPIGTNEVVITATDNCGNESTCSFNVTVEQVNNSHLLIQCPNDIVIECGEDIHLDEWPLPQVNSSCTSCDKDHIDDFINMGEFNGHRYFCSKYAATWEDANSIAQSLGGHLVIINSYDENHYLTNLLEVRSAYIGLSDRSHEGNFKWVNGEEMSYENWYPGQPNNYRLNQDYVELLKNGYWNDQYNYKKLEFIVEFSCVKIEQTKGPATPSDFSGTHAIIEYKVTDACGNVKRCHFNVSKEGSLDISCPQDIVVNLENGRHETVVSWDEPHVETCCNNCTTDAHSIPGFVYMGSRNGHRYYCSEFHATWHDAQAECENHGGYLAVINDEVENEMLANFLTVQSAYIGLSDHGLEGHFKWVNGAALNYSNWYPNQPNNYHDAQHYVEMLNSGQWNDQYSYKKREFIMELPGCIDLKQTKGPGNGEKFPVGTTTIKYTAKDNCGNHKSCSFTVTVKGGSESDLCINDHADSEDYWIESVQLGNKKNVSGNDQGYGNYTASCFSVSRGEVAAIKLSTGYGNDIIPVYWAIFIDWNKDGKFKSSESIAKGKSSSSLRGYFKFSNTIPIGKFNMRITMNPYGYHSNGCNPLYKGEIEDYCLEIKGTGYAQSSEIGKKLEAIKAITLEEYNAVDEEEIEDSRSHLDIGNSIYVFPNPFDQQVLIQGKDIKKINIISPSGQLIRSVVVSGNDVNQSIDLGNLSGGLYMLVLERADGTTELRKIVKK